MCLIHQFLLPAMLCPYKWESQWCTEIANFAVDIKNMLSNGSLRSSSGASSLSGPVDWKDHQDVHSILNASRMKRKRLPLAHLSIFVMSLRRLGTYCAY